MNELDHQQDRADEADQDHHQMIVEFVGSDPADSGGCLGIVIVFAASIAITLRFLLSANAFLFSSVYFGFGS